MATHEVFNQSVPLEGHDAAALDLALLEGVEREGAAAHLDDLHRVGARAGDPAWIHRGDLANRRLHHRWARFDARSKKSTIANTAIARELGHLRPE